MKPAISVILPVYNADKYLKEAIDSILLQTFSDFELLIYNDGSTDNSHNIINSYNDDRIIYKNFEKNIGYVYLLNSGLEAARGKYIARMDADDIAEPTRLEEQFDFLENNRDISICGSWFERIGDFSGIIELASSFEEIRYKLFYGTPLCHPTVMMNKEHLHSFDLRYNPEFYYAEDYEFFERASQYLKIVNLPKVLLKYRKHNTQVTNTKWQVQYYLTGKVQARRFLRTLLNSSNEDEKWMLNFFTHESIPNDDWLKEVDLYKSRIIEDNKISNVYSQLLLVKAVNKLFYENTSKNFYKFFFNKYYAAGKFNFPLLKSFIFNKYKPYKYLGVKLTLYFVIKCLIYYNKS